MNVLHLGQSVITKGLIPVHQPGGYYDTYIVGRIVELKDQTVTIKIEAPGWEEAYPQHFGYSDVRTSTHAERELFHALAAQRVARYAS